MNNPRFDTNDDYKKAKDKLSSTAKSQVKKQISKKISIDTIKNWVLYALKSLFKTMLAPLIIFLLIIMLIPIGIVIVATVFQTENASTLATDKVAQAVSTHWYNLQNVDETKATIVKHLNANYKCGADTGDLSISESGIYVYTETCEIAINFTPDLTTVSASISAYASAVNSTIAFHGDEMVKDDNNFKYDENGTIIGYDLTDFPNPLDTSNYIQNKGTSEDGLPNIDYSDSLKNDLRSVFDNEYTDITSDNFASEIKNFSGDFFILEKDFEYWEDNTIHKAELIREEEDSAFDTEKKYYVVNGYKGSATIPIYYDITSYKQDRLNELTDEIVSRNMKCIIEPMGEDGYGGNKICTQEEAEYIIYSTLQTYWINAMDYFGVDDLSYFGGSYGGIAGFSGSAFYRGSLDYNLYAGNRYSLSSTVAQTVWQHARYLHSQGLIGGSTTSAVGGCTFFAQMWFYDHHGFNQSGSGSSGNGKQWARVLLETHPDKFELGSSPAPYGVVSINYGKYGHIICIDSVDYANGIVTFSDGNYDGKGGVRIQETMTLEAFKTKFTGTYIYANPTKEYYAELQSQYGH